LINIEGALKYVSPGTIQRKYLATTDAQGNPVYSYGGGTWDSPENFAVFPIRLVKGLAEMRSTRYNPEDCVGFFGGTSLVSQGDHVNCQIGTFDVDKLRKYALGVTVIGFEAYLKEITPE